MAMCYVKAYFDWIEQMAALSDAERGRLFNAILEYARSGLEPKLDGRESILFPVFRSQIDRDNKKAAAVAENGKKGGRPITKDNQTKPNLTKQNQTKANKEEDKEEDKDYEKENTEKEIIKEKVFHKHGEFGWVKLSDEQFSKLTADLGDMELERCIRVVDESAQSTKNKNKWQDWNLVVRRCHREGWGINSGNAKYSRQNQSNTGDEPKPRFTVRYSNG